jgi:hypothetical protein
MADSRHTGQLAKAFIAFAIVLTASFASAAEAVWPKSSASELSAFATVLRFQIYADHCSATAPQLKPQFELLMEEIHRQIQGTLKRVLASAEFKGQKDMPVPAEIVNAIKDSFEDMKHNFERKAVADICTSTLQILREMDDAALQADLKEMLTSVRNMIRNTEAQSIK